MHMPKHIHAMYANYSVHPISTIVRRWIPAAEGVISVTGPSHRNSNGLTPIRIHMGLHPRHHVGKL